MNKELKFVLDVLQSNPRTAEKDLDWYWILGFLELNKIAVYFFNQIKQYGVKLPQSVERRMFQIIRSQTDRNVYLRKYICDINNELKFENIMYAFLKGSVLSNTNFYFSEKAFSCMAMSEKNKNSYRQQTKEAFYGEGERFSNDIDILIEQKDITIVSEVLKNMGFVQGYYDFYEGKIVPLTRSEILSRRMNRGETAPFVLATENGRIPFIEVDINFSLDYLPNSYENMLHEILKEAINYAGKVEGGIRSLKTDDFFLHLIMHQYKESILYSMVQRNKDFELYKLLDIYLFIKRGYIDLSGLYNKIKKYNLQKPFYYVMSSIAEVFNDFYFFDYNQMYFPKCGETINEVIDPKIGKRFLWTKPLSERLQFFDKNCFLQEAKNE